MGGAMSEPPPVTAQGPGRRLRTSGTVWGGAPGEEEARVVHIEPPDGARGVFCDTPVVASFSRPADSGTVCVDTFVVLDDAGPVPGHVWTSVDGRLAVWTPARLLTAGMLHRVRVGPVRDAQGRALRLHESTFVPGHLALGDLAPD
jgi:hypothetical protein